MACRGAGIVRVSARTGRLMRNTGRGMDLLGVNGRGYAAGVRVGRTDAAAIVALAHQRLRATRAQVVRRPWGLQRAQTSLPPADTVVALQDLQLGEQQIGQLTALSLQLEESRQSGFHKSSRTPVSRYSVRSEAQSPDPQLE